MTCDEMNDGDDEMKEKKKKEEKKLQSHAFLRKSIIFCGNSRLFKFYNLVSLLIERCSIRNER